MNFRINKKITLAVEESGADSFFSSFLLSVSSASV